MYLIIKTKLLPDPSGFMLVLIAYFIKINVSELN